jgi:hypothetical protein
VFDAPNACAEPKYRWHYDNDNNRTQSHPSAITLVERLDYADKSLPPIHTDLTHDTMRSTHCCLAKDNTPKLNPE